jgi:hypothetical protein
VWRLSGSTAAWHSDLLQASIDLQHPQQGLSGLQFGDQHLSSTRLLGVESTAACGDMHLQDCYVRGDDLVAQYRAAHLPLHLHVYWRSQAVSAPASRAVMLETLISVHTELLDSDPTVGVYCAVSSDAMDVFCEPGDPAPRAYSAADLGSSTRVPVGLAGAAIAFHLQPSPLVFAQWFAGADVCQATLRSDLPGGDVTSTIAFFRGRVEKGVIRRCHVQAILGDGVNMPRMLHDRWSGMLTAPPPLTT